MNPQLSSILTSVVVWACGVAASWFVAKGLIPKGDQATFTNDLIAIVTIGLPSLFAGVLAWWKQRQLSQKAMIEHINHTDNGLKVVASTVLATSEEAPLK